MNQVKNCLHCGASLDDSDSFCSYCGRQAEGVNTKKPLPRWIVVLAMVGVLFASAGLGYWYAFGRTDAVPDTPKPSVPVQNQQQAAPPIKEKQLNNPATYLPSPNFKYTVYQQFADGDQGTMDFLAAQVSDVAVISELELVYPPGEEPIGFVQHYLIRSDGIHSVYDSNVDLSDIWMKNNLSKGLQWEQHGIRTTVTGLGVACDLGFVVLQDCLVIERFNSSVDVEYQYYYAPGHGLVLKKDLRSGQTLYIVRSIDPIDPLQAKNRVQQYSPNRGLLK